MNSLRRTILAGTGTILAGLGGLWAVLSNDGNENTDDSSSGSNNATTRGGPTAQNASGNQSSAETEPEYPEAAQPPTNASVNESNVASPENASATQLTRDDFSIGDTSLETTANGAAVTGILINNSDHLAETVDVRVTFQTAMGKPIGTRMWGTNNLGAGETWAFSITANGEKFSRAASFGVVAVL